MITYDITGTLYSGNDRERMQQFHCIFKLVIQKILSSPGLHADDVDSPALPIYPYYPNEVGCSLHGYSSTNMTNAFLIRDFERVFHWYYGGIRGSFREVQQFALKDLSALMEIVPTPENVHELRRRAWSIRWNYLQPAV